MPLDILPFIVGPMQNNTYLVADRATRLSAVVDPSFDVDSIVPEAARRGWQIEQIWLTHGHFDHIAGVQTILDGLGPLGRPVKIGMHPADLELWRQRANRVYMGMQVAAGPEPDFAFEPGVPLQLGESRLEVRHVPGHTPGHVILYSAGDGVAFVGDVIFQGSIGRTDLPRGNYDQLIAGIHSQVLSLPDATRLLTGHGPETQVGVERITNPFLVG